MLDKIPANAFDDILILFNRISPLGVAGSDTLCQLVYKTLLMAAYCSVIPDSLAVKGMNDTQQVLIRKIAQRVNVRRNGAVITTLVHVHEPAMPAGERRTLHDRPCPGFVEVALFKHNSLNLFAGRELDVNIVRFATRKFLLRICFQKQRQAYQVTDNSVRIFMRDNVFVVDIR